MIWVLFGGLALLVIAGLLWPLVRAPQSSESRAAYDFMVFEDQLKEVERDTERGVLTAEEADAARLEIQRRILAARKIAAPAPTAGSTVWRGVLAGGLIALVPLFALAVYLPIGAPLLPGMSAVERAQMIAADSEEADQLLDQLAAHVTANPDDAEGWSLLARSYRQLRRYDEAAAAYREIARIAPSGDAYANLGEVLAAASGGAISPAAHEALMNALAVDRDEPRARFYLGLEQSQLGNAEAAIAIWRDLSADAPDDAPWLDLVMREMSRTAQQAGVMPMTVEPQHPLDLPQVTAAAEAPRAPSGIAPENLDMIKGMVDGLAARLESEPDDFDGWMMLGRSYTVLENMDGALNAYEKAMALKPADTVSRLQFASLMIARTDLDAPGPLPAKLTDAMSGVLEVSPAQPDALFITGLARAKAGETDEAKAHWDKALLELPAGSPLRREIERRLSALN